MGKTLDGIDDALVAWIGQQHLYFVATAPLAADGLVNCSPKGLDSFTVLDAHSVAYLDLTGSGIETVAHLQENGRIVVMFCAFEGAPQIVRLHGRGEPIFPGDPEFETLRARFPALPGVRSIVRVAVNRVSSSCGFGVPLYAYQGDRDTMIKSAEKTGEAALLDYQDKYNRTSIGGLPGVAKSVTDKARTLVAHAPRRSRTE